MNRRSLITGLGAGMLSSVLAERLSAGLQCQDGYGVRTCQAGIASDKMDTVYIPQKQSEWCWAACLEMVFGYYGHPVSQARIVKETWGVIANVPGQPGQIVADLNRAWVDDDGDSFNVRGDVFSSNAVTAAQDLSQDFPLIVGSLGHAMVLTAIMYQGNAYATRVIGATVRDPWPGRGERDLTTQEYLAAFLLARIRVY